MGFYISSAGLLFLLFTACGLKKENSVAPTQPIPAPELQNSVPPSKPSTPTPLVRENNPPIEVPPLTMKSLSSSSSVEKAPTPRTGDFFIPSGGESAVYPQDFAIGELGFPSSFPEASAFVLSFLSALEQGSINTTQFSHPADVDIKNIKNTVASVTPRYFRLGRGKEGNDRSLSFLFRYIGSEQSVIGELYLIPEKGSYVIQDMELESPETDKSKDGSYRYDPLGYTTIF